MAPACVIGKQPQSFAIPYHAVDSKDDGEYLTPLLRLSQIGAELTRLAYSTPNRIVSWAIVEEDVITEGPPDTDWWLVITRSHPLRLLEFRNWLSKRVPAEVDLERMVALTPMLQRRFGWGDARTTPELMEALRVEARLPCSMDVLTTARRDLAAYELKLRQPANIMVANPILATRRGQTALMVRDQLHDSYLVDRLQQSICALAPGSGPELADLEGCARTLSLGGPVRGVVALPLLNSTLAAIAAPPHVPDPDSEEESVDEEEVPAVRTVYQWGEAFTVYRKDRETHEEYWGHSFGSWVMT
jgi:hypothetical protein